MQVNLYKKKILITGGTGSVGKILIKRLLADYPSIGEIIVYSRDEFKQSQFSRKYKSKQLKLVIGDVRDAEKLRKVFQGVDIVIHAAAMKYLDICEANPDEAYKTNVIGTQNVIDAARTNQVKKVIFISTDKAADAISEYGRTKAEAERLISSAAEEGTTEYTILRLGNVLKSRGSVFEVFNEQAKAKTLTVFDKRSTRYLIKSSTLYKSVIYILTHSFNSVVIIPKLPVFKVSDLAAVYCKDCIIQHLQLRKGERVHEFLFSKAELVDAFENDRYFFILTNKADKSTILKIFKLRKVDLEYPESSQHGKLLTVKELETLITKKKNRVKTSSVAD